MIVLPILSAPSGPSSPASPCTPSRKPSHDLDVGDVVRGLRSARRVVVICGAGISTAASIPDFRSSGGLFGGGTTGKGKGKAGVKDLFHVKCLTSSSLLAAHQELLTELASLSTVAQPTAFHSFLNTLDQEGRLSRCYTQNIDGLEARAGLSVGIPVTAKRKRGKVDLRFDPRLLEAEADFEATTPRCIPLHGQLTTLYCPLCSTIVPLAPYLPLPPTTIPCPTCDFSASIRHALSERTHRVGSLRASVVLYGEEHSQGEAIGSVVESDLRGKEGKVDFLLVAGTSLAIPGVKRIVKEMARAVRSTLGRGAKVVYINDAPAAKMAEWEDVFDVWLKGDVQRFVIDHLSESPRPTSPLVTPANSKRRRPGLPTPETSVKRAGKTQEAPKCSSDFTTPTKAPLSAAYLPTPRETPPSRTRVCLEGTLTPLSDSGFDSDLDESGGENPFLDLARGLPGSEG